MAEVKYTPVPHDHKAFLARARARKGFSEAYDALELEYEVAGQMLQARSRAGLTQDAVAERMGTTKSAVSRLESAGKHAPSLATLKRRLARAEKRFVAPTPTIDPVIVCVVLTGIFRCVAIWIAIAPPVSAANPPIGLSFVMREPIVCTIRHPPNSVPSDMAEYAPISTHRGILLKSST